MAVSGLLAFLSCFSLLGKAVVDLMYSIIVWLVSGISLCHLVVGGVCGGVGVFSFFGPRSRFFPKCVCFVYYESNLSGFEKLGSRIVFLL